MIAYPISEIFGPSLQGEGHFVGYPMVFVRFAGCSVRDCHIRRECDEAPWKAKATLSAQDIVAEVRRLLPAGVVCLTGGEPTDHDIVPLVDLFTAARYRIHVETSGKRPVVGLPIEWLTVSPKTSSYAQRTGNTLKVVVRPEWTWAEVRALDTDTSFFHRYLQPLTDPATGEALNLSQVIAMVLSQENVNGRWALSTQKHRTWGVR